MRGRWHGYHHHHREDQLAVSNVLQMTIIRADGLLTLLLEDPSDSISVDRITTPICQVDSRGDGMAHRAAQRDAVTIRF